MALAILWVSNNLYVIPVPGEAGRKININPEMVEFEEDGTFSVPSETKRDVFYSVSMELRTCTTCPQGMLKGPCKHRTVVSLSQNLPSFDVVPELNTEMRKMWIYIGTGKHIDHDQFLPLSNVIQWYNDTMLQWYNVINITNTNNLNSTQVKSVSYFNNSSQLVS